jgi:16S rRNA (cytidine1402-2'-O)-methyltransferase
VAVCSLRELKNLPERLILLDALYRLMPLLKDVQAELGQRRPVAVACNLTMPEERILRGAVGFVIEALERQPFKGEFVLIIQGNNTARKLKGELT